MKYKIYMKKESVTVKGRITYYEQVNEWELNHLLNNPANRLFQISYDGRRQLVIETFTDDRHRIAVNLKRVRNWENGSLLGEVLYLGRGDQNQYRMIRLADEEFIFSLSIQGRCVL